MGTEPAEEICIESLQIESLEKAVEIGHSGALARDPERPRAPTKAGVDWTPTSFRL